jgi:heme exporter protein CcmD
MVEHHWTFVAVAYGFTALCIAAELFALAHRRRQALRRVERERDFDEDERVG